MTPFRPEAACPLDGITVLDLSRLVAGNMVSLQLADFGAEVIKIEDPGKGDPLRHWRVEGHSLFWKAYARNKKSVTLDLRKPRAKELFELSDRLAHRRSGEPQLACSLGVAPACHHFGKGIHRAELVHIGSRLETVCVKLDILYQFNQRHKFLGIHPSQPRSATC